MSQLQPGTCRDPGPGDAHCTLEWDHQFSCYDEIEDVSFNDRQEFTHNCDDLICDQQGFRSNGD